MCGFEFSDSIHILLSIPRIRRSLVDLHSLHDLLDCIGDVSPNRTSDQ